MSAVSSAILDTLHTWLRPRLDPLAQAWLAEKCHQIATGDKKSLFLSFGMAARKVGKEDLRLSAEELAAAVRVRPAWNPQGWTIDQAARMAMVLSFPVSDAQLFVSVLDQLFATGEVHELIALYQGLPLYPHPELFQLRCAEGQRSNIPAVFCAIAHRNPFPSEQLSDDQWNQLVLKSLFIGVALNPIIGLDQRANLKLAAILVDFAHERWAAKRPVSPELWRCVGPFADDAGFDALTQVLTTGTDVERQAAVLALRSNPSPEAHRRLRIAGVDITPYATWEQIALQNSHAED